MEIEERKKSIEKEEQKRNYEEERKRNRKRREERREASDHGNRTGIGSIKEKEMRKDVVGNRRE